MHIPALKVTQWLTEWDTYRFSEDDRQRKPEPHFYLSSIPASILRRLSNVPRRGSRSATGRQEALGPRAEDVGVQRAFEVDRADRIKAFVRAGYPWATLREAEKDSFPHLKKPGWLATALVLNVVNATTVRENTNPDPRDLVSIEQTGPTTAQIVIPSGAESPDWEPNGRIRPLEVIDGQHRLLAFDDAAPQGGPFELPVVLFEDLDISWQAYLFWTINISPKRIGPSLAYDLYPLLRTEDWLDPVPGPLAYRETRAQELTEALWSNPESPWYQRIGMLGREGGLVTQAAFVRSLTQSFIRRSDFGSGRPGGLFGAPLRSETDRLLPWSRSQQAAYLIFLWSELEEAINEIDPPWARHIREHTDAGQLTLPVAKNPAFAGTYSLLATDQGVRGFLQVANDVSFSMADELDIASWLPPDQSSATMVEEVNAALQLLRSGVQSAKFVSGFCECVAAFDWRTLATPGLSEEIRIHQALYRTGTGYREVRRQLLLHLANQPNQLIANRATEIIGVLGF